MNQVFGCFIHGLSNFQYFGFVETWSIVANNFIICRRKLNMQTKPVQKMNFNKIERLSQSAYHFWILVLVAFLLNDEHGQKVRNSFPDW